MLESSLPAASAYASYACVPTWLTDFREDLSRIDVPTLVVHGDADRILPYQVTGPGWPAGSRTCRWVTVEGGPHNIAWTHATWSTRPCSTSGEVTQGR